MVNVPSNPGQTAVARRPHLVFPTLLIAAGMVLLLVTTGAVDQAVGWRLLQMWPLLLVLLGLELVLGWALPTVGGRILTAAALIVLTLAAIVFAFAAPATTGNPVRSSLSAPASGISHPTLVLNVAGATVDLRAAAHGDDLYSASFAVTSGRQPDISLDRAAGTVTVAFKNQFPAFFQTSGDRIIVELNQDLPWQIEVSSAGTTTTADLSSISMSGLRLSGAGTKFTATLPKPTGVVHAQVTGVGTSAWFAVPAGTVSIVSANGIATTVGGNAVTTAGTSRADAADRYEVELSGVGANLTINEVQ